MTNAPGDKGTDTHRDTTKWWVRAWLFMTILALLWVLGFPAFYNGIADSPEFLKPFRGYWGCSTGLGETGDYLTGWLTPLALFWFILAVFLQKRELSLQREEFKLMRGEYEESRRAAQKQAEQAEQQVTQLILSNTINERQLFKIMLDDTLKITGFRATQMYKQICSRFGKTQQNIKSFEDEFGKENSDLVRFNFEIDNMLIKEPNKLQLFGENNLPAIATNISEQLEYLRDQADEIGLLDFYIYRYEGTPLKETHRICKGLLNLWRPDDDATASHE